jgi:benzylsuccinate CoA-transferase BbsF subunit
LVAWADILIESFTPSAIDDMGFSYERLSKTNPGLIMVSTGILGRTGPYGKGTSGTGVTGSSFAGATGLLGWTDRKPFGPRGPWTDAVSPRFVVSSVLAALHRRKQTNQGCYIDVAQAECGLQFLLPAFMQFSAHRHDPARRGRAGSEMRSPCGIYPCTGSDRWIAIDASEESSWASLRELAGGTLRDSLFDTVVGRLRHREQIDKEISGWTKKQDATELELRLQQAGVAAHVVSQSLDLTNDSDRRYQGYYRPIADSAIGQTETIASQFSLSSTPTIDVRPGPRIGDSTAAILREVCGYTKAEIDRFAADGITE